MAHFKRGKCRRNCPRSIRGSDTSWRARHGFSPVRVPDFDEAYPHVSYWDRGAWLQAWHEHRKLWDGPPGKGHLSMMHSSPAWHDRTFHTRPKRIETRRLAKMVLQGADPDDIVWPLSSRRPTIYYW